MSYVYIETERHVWTVGHYGPGSEWHADSDHGNREDAAARVHYLNGGARPPEKAQDGREDEGIPE